MTYNLVHVQPVLVLRFNFNFLESKSKSYTPIEYRVYYYEYRNIYY